MAADMTQTTIPFVFMRGGTSRGPYLNRADLPEDRDQLADVLIAMVGSGHPLNIDGDFQTDRPAGTTKCSGSRIC